MTTSLCITNQCTIRSNTIFKNGTAIWKDEATDDADSFLINAYKKLELGYPKFFKMDNLAKLGWLASEVLLQDIRLKEKYKSEEISVVFSNASSSLDADAKYQATIKDIASPALFVYTLPNIVIGEICIRNGLKGENAFFVFNKFEAAFLQQYVESLIQQNSNKACIFGWVEIIGNNYEAALFLIEKTSTETSEPFTTENINKLYS